NAKAKVSSVEDQLAGAKAVKSNGRRGDAGHQSRAGRLLAKVGGDQVNAARRVDDYGKHIGKGGKAHGTGKIRLLIPFFRRGSVSQGAGKEKRRRPASHGRIPKLIMYTPHSFFSGWLLGDYV